MNNLIKLMCIGAMFSGMANVAQGSEKNLSTFIGDVKDSWQNVKTTDKQKAGDSKKQARKETAQDNVATLQGYQVAYESNPEAQAEVANFKTQAQADVASYDDDEYE